jgi:hypothetical protein
LSDHHLCKLLRAADVRGFKPGPAPGEGNARSWLSDTLEKSMLDLFRNLLRYQELK